MSGPVESILARPFMYSALHTMTGLRKLHGQLLEQVMQIPGIPANPRVLDLGCGPGDTLKLIRPGTSYTGIDLNPYYVAIAKEKSVGGADFVVGDVTRLESSRFEPFDLVIMFGLIHHLDDCDADALLSAAARLLKPSGRVISLDGCRRADNSAAVRWLLDHDRGKYVREAAGYLELIGRHLAIETTFADPSVMNIPYSILSVTARPRLAA